MTNPAYHPCYAELAKRVAKRKYQREWRKNNPDKVKEYNERYWEKKGREYLAALHNGEGRA